MTDPLQSFVNMLRKIEVRYGKAGWHGEESVPPALYGIFREHGRLTGQELVVSNEVWSKAPPGEVLSAAAEMMAEHPLLLIPFQGTDWVGLALAMEAWVVTTSDPVKWSQIETMAEHRLIHTHPERETIRVVYGITREQDRAMLFHQESGPGVEVYTDQNFPGGIQEGLAALVGAIDALL